MVDFKYFVFCFVIVIYVWAFGCCGLVDFIWWLWLCFILALFVCFFVLRLDVVCLACLVIIWVVVCLGVCVVWIVGFYWLDT